MKTANLKALLAAKPEDSPLALFLDGLDGTVDGRGYNAEHDKARCLLEAAPDLLKACKAFLAKWHRQGMDAGMQLEKFDQIARDMYAAIDKAEPQD